MKKQLLIVGIVILILTIGLNGCITEKPIVAGTGTIVYNDFEGGFYGIVADSLNPGYPFRRLDPINLPQEFMEENLQVSFKIRLRPDLYSFHMWGVMVEILEIKKL